MRNCLVIDLFVASVPVIQYSSFTDAECMIDTSVDAFPAAFIIFVKTVFFFRSGGGSQLQIGDHAADSAAAALIGN